MKKIAILVMVCSLLLPLVTLRAEEVIGDIRPNVLNPNRLDVVDTLGHSNYYLERDVLRPERWIIYHRDSGHRAGVIERNPLKMYNYDIQMKAPTGIRMKSVKPTFRRFTK